METQALHACHLHKSQATFIKSYACLHLLLLAFIIYFRLSSVLDQNNPTPLLPSFLVFASELLLSFLALLGLAYRWRPVSRTTFPERLPKDEEKLPALDVFIFTSDPVKEPIMDVMSTVVSAMTLDYPPKKLSVYLSDDGGCSFTLYALREALNFARWWLPFCRKYKVISRCPKAYFSNDENGSLENVGFEFLQARKKIEEKYEVFDDCIRRAQEKANAEANESTVGRSHPPVIEVINNGTVDKMDAEQTEFPLLIYVSREKRPFHLHHFKAGAFNVLLRVSSIISNAPYILSLDCDMYPNDPMSARQAMCFHLDTDISSSLAFVQFPQKFHNLSKFDIYGSQLRSTFDLRWLGMDGLSGPMLSGTCFYMKRRALVGSTPPEDMNLLQLKQRYGTSNQFIKSLKQSLRGTDISRGELSSTLFSEIKHLACCSYEEGTQWGQQVGFLYGSVLEDYFTGYMLHCRGWKSIYCYPSRPAFMGSATTSLNDLLIQNTRWQSGSLDVTFSWFCPLFYGLLKTSFLQSMCYAYLAVQPLCSLPMWCLATVSQLCLLHGIPIYPKVSSSWFIIFALVFISPLLKDLVDVLLTGGPIQTWWNEERIWMLKSVTAYPYGTLDAILKKIGLRQASFIITSKVDHKEKIKLYHSGKFNFQTSSMFLIPLAGIVILNMVSFAGGVTRAIATSSWDEMFAQIFLSFFILIVSFPVTEGMILRKDKGSVPPSVTLASAFFALLVLFLGSIFLIG
ncbi:hypothetical protein Ancab_013183 [Ancistrocladus abbreviatus]